MMHGPSRFHDGWYMRTEEAFDFGLNMGQEDIATGVWWETLKSQPLCVVFYRAPPQRTLSETPAAQRKRTYVQFASRDALDEFREYFFK